MELERTLSSSVTGQEASEHSLRERLKRYWMLAWMRYAGTGFWGRVMTRIAAWPAPPHKARTFMAYMNPKGYIAANSVMYHSDLHIGSNVFMDDRVVIFQRKNGGPLKIGDRVCIYRDAILETGYGGSLTIGNRSSIHPRCQLNAYVSPIRIGSRVMIAPNCAFYPYDHGMLPGQPIAKQALQSKGGITIDDDAWLAFGVIVLGGVRIGKGAVVGAGSVVTRDVPDGAIAAGVPARVMGMRNDLT